MKKRLVLVLMAMVMACSTAACGGNVSDENSKKGIISKEDSFGYTLGKFSKDATIEETVLYDKNDVKITATELVYEDYEVKLKLKIDNKSKKNLSFNAETLGYAVNAINGFMIGDGYLDCDVNANETAEDTMSFDYRELMMYGMKEIADITVGFTISDEEYNSIHTDPVQIKTSAADTYDYSKNSKNYHKAITSKSSKYTYEYELPYFETDEIYASNGIRVVSEGYMKNVDGERILFLEVQNDSDSMVYFQTSDLKLNGETVYEGDWSYDCILPGCETLVNIDVDDALDDLEEPKDSVQKIESIGFKVQAENEAQYVVSEPTVLVVAVPVIEGETEDSTEE